jgi:hypothetical protein
LRKLIKKMFLKCVIDVYIFRCSMGCIVKVKVTDNKGVLNFNFSSLFSEMFQKCVTRPALMSMYSDAVWDR